MCFVRLFQRSLHEQGQAAICHHYYYPGRFGERIFLLVCEHGALRVHRGERTGQPVAFSRMSDARRLCDVRNGTTFCMTCCATNVVDPLPFLEEASHELDDELYFRRYGKKRRRRRNARGNTQRKGVAHVC